MILEWLGLLIALYLMWFLIDNYSPFRNRPPGPLCLPIIGNLLSILTKHAIFKSKPSFMVFQYLSQKYGPLCYFRASYSLEILIIDDFDIAKQLLKQDIWADRPFNPQIPESIFAKGLGIVFTSGEGWKERRRFSIKTLRDFGYGKQTSMQPIMEDEVKALLGKVDKVASGKEPILPIKHLFTMSVHNILWSMVSKQRSAEDDAKLRKLLTLVDNVFKATPIGGSVLPVLPFLRHIFPKWTGRTFLIKCWTELQAYFKDVLEGRRKEGCYAEDERDFIDMFLKEIDKNTGKGGNISENHYTDEQFITTISELFMAGSETSSSTLEFAVFFSMKHPHVQEKIQEEIDRVIGRNRCPTMADRNEMPFTEATLLEVQRLSNVAPVAVRSSSGRTQLMGYDIPKGTTGIVNIYSIHMNRGFWKDPEAFRPERFLDENSKLIPERVSRVIPFGAGKRVCIGEQLARTSMFIYFTSLLQHYTFVDLSKKAFSEYRSFEDYTDVGFALSPKPFLAKVLKRE